MYQHVLSARIFLSLAMALFILSLVLGWISFSVPDWLEYYDRSILNTTTSIESDNELVKFGLWYRCVFSTLTNDFNCASWKTHVPSFVRVVQVFVPFSLTLGCLALAAAFIGFVSRRSSITSVLIAALLAFLSFMFATIAVTVFATESVVFVDRFRISLNEYPRRWGMWIMIPYLVLMFLGSVCCFLSSLLDWSDYRRMQVTGILSHSVDKYGDNVFKDPSENNLLTQFKRPGNLQEYPNACFQLNGYPNSNPGQGMSYPGPPNYPNNSNVTNISSYPTPFGYSRGASPSANGMFTTNHHDALFTRHNMMEYSDSEDAPRSSRCRRHSRSHHRSSHRSRSRSPRDGNSVMESQAKQQAQFIPIAVPYYQPTTTLNGQSNNGQASHIVSSMKNNQTLSYLLPQTAQHLDDNFHLNNATTNKILSYGPGQPSMVVSNPNQPVYTISYRPNGPTGNVFGSNVISGAGGATYVTVMRNPSALSSSLLSDDEDDRKYNHLDSAKTKNDAAWSWMKL